MTAGDLLAVLASIARLRNEVRARAAIDRDLWADDAVLGLRDGRGKDERERSEEGNGHQESGKEPLHRVVRGRNWKGLP